MKGLTLNMEDMLQLSLSRQITPTGKIEDVLQMLCKETNH